MSVNDAALRCGRIALAWAAWEAAAAPAIKHRKTCMMAAARSKKPELFCGWNEETGEAINCVQAPALPPPVDWEAIGRG